MFIIVDENNYSDEQIRMEFIIKGSVFACITDTASYFILTGVNNEEILFFSTIFQRHLL